MATAYTTRTNQRGAHAHAGTPPGFQQPFPGQAPVVLSPDQFKTFMETYAHAAPVRPVPDDGAR